jgi:hypothetical protein
MLDEREDFDAMDDESPTNECVRCRTCWDWYSPEEGDDNRCLLCRRWIAEAEKYRRLAEQQRQREVVM